MKAPWLLLDKIADCLDRFNQWLEKKNNKAQFPTYWDDREE